MAVEGVSGSKRKGMLHPPDSLEARVCPAPPVRTYPVSRATAESAQKGSLAELEIDATRPLTRRNAPW